MRIVQVIFTCSLNKQLIVFSLTRTAIHDLIGQFDDCRQATQLCYEFFCFLALTGVQRLLQFSAGSRGEFLRPEYFNFKVFCLVSSTANSVKTFGHRTLLLPLPPKLICSRIFEVCERDYVRHCCIVLAHQQYVMVESNVPMHVVLSDKLFCPMAGEDLCCTCCNEKNKRCLSTSTYLSLCHCKTSLFWFEFILGSLSAALQQQQPKKKNAKMKAKPSLRYFFFKITSRYKVWTIPRWLGSLVIPELTSQETMTRPAGQTNQRLLQYQCHTCFLFIESHSVFCPSHSLFVSPSAQTCCLGSATHLSLSNDKKG